MAVLFFNVSGRSEEGYSSNGRVLQGSQCGGLAGIPQGQRRSSTASDEALLLDRMMVQKQYHQTGPDHKQFKICIQRWIPLTEAVYSMLMSKDNVNMTE